MIKVGQAKHAIRTVSSPVPESRHIEIAFGQRLSSMSLDSSRIVTRGDGIYSAGEIVIAIDTGVRVQMTILAEPDVIELVEHQTSRSLLLRHGIGLMRTALGVNDGLQVEVSVPMPLPHCGLGTSSLMVAVVAIAMNELYGRPLSDQVLARYIAQNHGEEKAGEVEMLYPVQCLGGSGVANLYRGALQVMAGETTIIATADIPETYRVVIGIPADLQHTQLDVAELMEAEDNQADGFTKTGEQYAARVAYDLVHEGLPGMVQCDFTGIGKVIFNHRFNWGSIRNCRFSHPRLVEIADGVRHLWEEGTAPILGLSSAGPAFYAVTEQVEACRCAFAEQGLDAYIVPLFNDRYRVIERRGFDVLDTAGVQVERKQISTANG